MEFNPNFSEKARHDYKLILLALKGDQKAYAELLGRYRDAIYFMLLKIINNKIDAEDLTIEAFTKAFKNIHQYSPEFAFSTWLFKIATNNCIDYLRKRKKRMISLDDIKYDYDDDTSISLESNTLSPAEELIKKQKESLMHTIVKNLKPRYRKLVELRYFKEYSYKEIADEMDLPIGTVKAQLYRARELLSQTLLYSGGNI